MEKAELEKNDMENFNFISTETADRNSFYFQYESNSVIDHVDSSAAESDLPDEFFELTDSDIRIKYRDMREEV